MEENLQQIDELRNIRMLFSIFLNEIIIRFDIASFPQHEKLQINAKKRPLLIWLRKKYFIPIKEFFTKVCSFLLLLLLLFDILFFFLRLHFLSISFSLRPFWFCSLLAFFHLSQFSCLLPPFLIYSYKSNINFLFVVGWPHLRPIFCFIQRQQDLFGILYMQK